MNYLARAIALFIALAFACLMLVGCKSKQKTTERYRNETQFDAETSTSQVIENNLQTDSAAVRKTQTNWSELIKNLDINPLNPDKPSRVKISEDESGATIIETQNAQVSTQTQQKQKTETTADSTYKKTVDQGRQELDNNSTSSGQTLDAGRNSGSETKGLNTWVAIGLGLALFVLLILFVLKVYANRSTIAGKIKNKLGKWL